MSDGRNPNGPKIGALWLSANIQYTADTIVVQPPMMSQAMIGTSQLPNVVQVTRSSKLPSVNFSIVALRSDDHKRLTIRVVNLNATAVTAAVVVGRGAAWSGTMTVLTGKLDDYNSPEKPHQISPNETAVTASQLKAGLNFSGHSFTVLNLTRSVTPSTT
eukprot:SAG31_NODE_1098_length_9919_cov_2.877495_5_plen_160_part_00